MKIKVMYACVEIILDGLFAYTRNEEMTHTLKSVKKSVELFDFDEVLRILDVS